LRRQQAGLALLGVLAASAGCRPNAREPASGARLELRVTGSDTSTFAAPAHAEWCDSLKVLEIVATGGDTGVGIALYPRERVVPGAYPVRPPERADSVPPSAAIGVRWFSQTAIRGFQGDSGEVTITRASDGALAGRFTGTAHAIAGRGQLTLTGTFHDLRERPATRGCTGRHAAPSAEPSDSGEGID
jgi:hypothetical protein